MSSSRNTDRDFENKWSSKIAGHGHTQVPNILLQNINSLDLNPTDFAVICQLVMYKWSKSNPFPSVDRVAGCIGCSARTVRRSIARLEKKGYIRRVYRSRQTNEYDLSGLIACLSDKAAYKNPRMTKATLNPDRNVSKDRTRMSPKEDPSEKDQVKKTSCFQHISSELDKQAKRLTDTGKDSQ